jgi:hypothetical protein
VPCRRCSRSGSAKKRFCITSTNNILESTVGAANLYTSAIMRQKRAKAYRKLMHVYSMSFGFRQPYQVLGMSTFIPLPGSNQINLLPQSIQKCANQPWGKTLTW